MLRSVTLGVVLSVLAVACTLAEAPPSAGTFTIEAVVRNLSPSEVVLRVSNRRGEVPSAVQPDAMVPAGPSTTNLTLKLPADGQWTLGISGWGEIDGKELEGLQCPLAIMIDAMGCAVELRTIGSSCSWMDAPRVIKHRTRAHGARGRPARRPEQRRPSGRRRPRQQDQVEFVRESFALHLSATRAEKTTQIRA